MRLLAVLAIWLGLAVPAAALTPDPHWPQPLPAGWVLGEVSGVTVDAQDHVWVLHRPATARGTKAPPVLEFDPAGKLLRAWGGPGPGYDWFESEHSIAVDSAGHVWLTGNGTRDGHILAFDADGHFIRQIGHPGPNHSASNDPSRLARPAGIAVDHGEVFVADGYTNRRVIVFDAVTGAYKRHWGAYGARPDDAPGARRQFALPVHCVHVAQDGLVYVCDRRNDRVQVFRRDGTYLSEWRIAPATPPPGSAWDLALNPADGEMTVILADGGNERLHILRRADGRALSTLGAPGQFHWLHAVAMDRHGSVYTAEITGRRILRWAP